MDDFIYNQKKIPKQQWRYGFRSSAATGCGWIATYNALKLLGDPREPEELIRYYQRLLPLIHGNAGTTFPAPALFFKKLGYRVKLHFKREHFDAAAKAADVCLLYYYWRRKAKVGAHFVALQHTEQGFVGYNTFTNSTGADRYGGSLEDFLKRQHYFGCVLITVSK